MSVLTLIVVTNENLIITTLYPLKLTHKIRHHGHRKRGDYNKKTSRPKHVFTYYHEEPLDKSSVLRKNKRRLQIVRHLFFVSKSKVSFYITNFMVVEMSFLLVGLLGLYQRQSLGNPCQKSHFFITLSTILLDLLGWFTTTYLWQS